jgi:hypothetical protein
MMSGGPIEKFTEGWALRIFSWGAAHYYVREGAGLAKPLCRSEEVPAGFLRGLGNWRQCKNCLRRLEARRAS